MSTVCDTGYRCIDCEYDLSGTAIGGQCPECGRPIVDSIRADESQNKTSSLATTSLVLGVVSVAVCALAGPVAWYVAAKAKEEMKPGGYSSSSLGMATAGYVLGIIGTVLCVMTVLFFSMYGLMG